MATDPGTLLAQANCYACFGNGGTWQILELALLAQWSVSNLVPAGATYDAGGQFLLTVIAGQQYFVTLFAIGSGGNDGILDNNGVPIVAPATHVGFVATVNVVAFHGTSNALVTAILTTS